MVLFPCLDIICAGCENHVVHLSETSYLTVLFDCGTSLSSCLQVQSPKVVGGSIYWGAVLIKLFISGSSNHVLCNLFSLQEYTLDTIL